MIVHLRSGTSVGAVGKAHERARTLGMIVHLRSGTSVGAVGKAHEVAGVLAHATVPAFIFPKTMRVAGVY
jgi:hypothetical protein